MMIICLIHRFVYCDKWVLKNNQRVTYVPDMFILFIKLLTEEMQHCLRLYSSRTRYIAFTRDDYMTNKITTW